MEGPKTKLTHRKLGPVKLLKKRSKRAVARTAEDLERIRYNAELEAFHKAQREGSYFNSNF